jgi:hypothetical protein
MYTAIIFLMVLGLTIGIYSSSYNQFNLNNTQQITSINTNFANSAQLTPNAGSDICDIFCQIWGGIVNAGLSICNAIGTPGCIIGGGATNLAQVLSLGQNKSATLRNIQIANGVANSATASSNQWLGNILGNPLDEALLIMGIFLGIGLFAGLLGAGLLARVVASVGIGLSVIVFIEGQLGTFNNLPALIFIPFNGIMAMLLLIIAWESFNTPGSAA